MRPVNGKGLVGVLGQVPAATHTAGMANLITLITTHMPNGKARRIWIVEGGYCSDTRYEEKLEEKEAQHTALEVALKEYGCDVTVLPSSLIWFNLQDNKT